jgi:hypothetical protein
VPTPKKSKPPSGQHDEVLRRIAAIARELEHASLPRKAEPFEARLERLQDAVGDIAKSWSGSVLGRHSLIYLDELRPAGPGEAFDSEWGLEGGAFVNRTRGAWKEYTFDQVRNAVHERAEVTEAQLDKMMESANEAHNLFLRHKATLDGVFRALLGTDQDEHVAAFQKELAAFKPGPNPKDFAEAMLPRGGASRDSAAVFAGRKVPPHLHVLANVQYVHGKFLTCANFATRVGAALEYLRTKYALAGTTTLKGAAAIFIGHGRSNEYLKLARFIDNRLGLKAIYYESEAAAGQTTQERIDELKSTAGFAFLVFTCEDRQEGGAVRTRQNVVQEYGTMEAHLGREKAIILREDGCEIPSNDTNVTYIPFPGGHLDYAFEQVREVLEKAGLI